MPQLKNILMVAPVVLMLSYHLVKAFIKATQRYGWRPTLKASAELMFYFVSVVVFAIGAFGLIDDFVGR